jgi:hypothetical protein
LNATFHSFWRRGGASSHYMLPRPIGFASQHGSPELE